MPIRAVLFDVYGTLLDVHSAIAREGKELGPTADAVSRLWRQKQLEYTWVWSLRGAHRSFRALTEAALDFALTSHGIHSAVLRDRLMTAYEKLDAFPEVAEALTALRAQSRCLAALSNGDPDMLETGLQAAGIRTSLDAVLSVAPLQIFKPDRKVYGLGRAWVGAPAEEITFVSANAWDAAGAAGFGFRTFWINRIGQPEEYDIAGHATVIGSLRDLVAHVA
ncbi:haloacid dehalogenase type II [Dongia deserti]|uniref:haloacid dehalogenase type II n=1 Tax=Dongia deserti TaxID=2268030 RepID=UPI000E65207F|nr:haloacid dehalogenase type II [Dongia deserti]